MMIRKNRIVLTCFLGALAFALTLLILVFLTIPDIRGLGLTSMDIAVLMIGDAPKAALSLITLLMVCALAAMVVARSIIGHEHQQLLLRKQLFTAYANLQESQDELRHIKETLSQSSVLAHEMREKLKRLERGAPPVLASSDYDILLPSSRENYLAGTLETVTDELAQASDALREIMPSAHALEHTLSPLHARADAAGKALTLLDGLIQRLNRLVLNATLEAARFGQGGETIVRLMDECKFLARDTAEQASAIGEQIWHLKETLTLTKSPLLTLRDEAVTTLRHLTEATELLDNEWDRLMAKPEADPALTRAVADAAKQAELLEKRMSAFTHIPREAA